MRNWRATNRLVDISKLNKVLPESCSLSRIIIINHCTPRQNQRHMRIGCWNNLIKFFAIADLIHDFDEFCLMFHQKTTQTWCVRYVSVDIRSRLYIKAW